MINRFLKDRPSKLFIGFAAFFVANALIAECIGGKLFSLEKVFGLAPANLSIFGVDGLSFTLTCGGLLWPLEFVITDIINEFYGPKAVKRISYTAIILIGYAFIMFYLSIHAPASDFWIGSGKDQGIDNMQTAFTGIFGQGMWIIVGSLMAFMFSQLVDVYVFHKIKKKTGDKMIWLRASGSSLVSKFVDSYIVLIIAFKVGNNWPWSQVLAIGVISYIYKSTTAIILTPVIIYVEKWIEKYVGKETAHKMRLSAMGKNVEDVMDNIPNAG